MLALTVATSPLPTWLGPTAGQTLDLVDLRLLEGRTAPPGPLGEAELISLMEKHGIGTDASISTHIGTIEARRYARLVGEAMEEMIRTGEIVVEEARDESDDDDAPARRPQGVRNSGEPESRPHHGHHGPGRFVFGRISFRKGL